MPDNLPLSMWLFLLFATTLYGTILLFAAYLYD